MQRIKRNLKTLRKLGVSVLSLYLAISALGLFMGGNSVEGALYLGLAFLLDNKLELAYIRDSLEAKNESTSNCQNCNCGRRS